ncbi:hypothetical protein FHS85_001505 [Rhodoligotrophos appendicifer]
MLFRQIVEKLQQFAAFTVPSNVCPKHVSRAKIVAFRWRNCSSVPPQKRPPVLAIQSSTEPDTTVALVFQGYGAMKFKTPE